MLALIYVFSLNTSDTYLMKKSARANECECIEWR